MKRIDWNFVILKTSSISLCVIVGGYTGLSLVSLAMFNFGEFRKLCILLIIAALVTTWAVSAIVKAGPQPLIEIHTETKTTYK